MPREFETKLVIISDKPDALIEEIGSLKSIGDYQLFHKKTNILHDTYFDTSVRSLSRQGISLRLRDISGDVVLCLKEKDHTDKQGAKLRNETEIPFSDENSTEILTLLKKVIDKDIEISIQLAAPKEYLKSLGLTIIHERETTRTALDAGIPIENNNVILAEIALDSVSYNISECIIRHYEIEVEAKAQESEDHVLNLTNLIRGDHSDKLMPWDHNKLITGIVLQQLYSQGTIHALPGETLYLNRSLYNDIDAYLKTSK